jgi:hypothetical protein
LSYCPRVLNNSAEVSIASQKPTTIATLHQNPSTIATNPIYVVTQIQAGATQIEA